MKSINKLKLVVLASLVATNSLFAQIITNADFGSLGNYNAFAGDFFEVEDATFTGTVGLANGSSGTLENGVLNGDVLRHTGASFDGSGGTLNGSVITSGAINTDTNAAFSRFTPLKNLIEGFASSTGNLGNKNNSDIVFSTLGNTSTSDVMTVIDYNKVQLDNGSLISLTGRAGFNDVFVFRMDELDAKQTVMDLTNVSASNIIWYGRDEAYGNHDKAGGGGKKGGGTVDPNFSFSGILFSPEGEAKVGGGGVFEGAVYASEIKIGSGAIFDGVPPVPEPSSIALLGLGSLSLILRRKRKCLK